MKFFKKSSMFLVLSGIILISMSNILNVHAMTSAKSEIAVLSMLHTNLDSMASKAGDSFSAEIMEDITLDNQIIVPKFSIIYGTVLKVKHPALLSNDAYIRIKVIQIKIEGERLVSIENKPVIIQISPMIKTQKNGMWLKKIPGSIANTTTSIILNHYCSIAYPAVWAIGTGAGMTASALSGAVFPDKEKTVIDSSASRVIECSPVGYVNFAATTGAGVCLNSGEYLNINFDKDTIRNIKEQIFFNNNNQTAN